LDHLYNSDDYPAIVNNIDEQFYLSSIAEVLEETMPPTFHQTDQRFPSGITEDYLLSEQFVFNGIIIQVLSKIYSYFYYFYLKAFHPFKLCQLKIIENWKCLTII